MIKSKATHHPLALILVLAVLALVVGCGGDDGSTTSESSTAVAETAGQDPAPDPTAQFVSEADAICSQSSKQIQAKLRPLLQGEGPEEPSAAAIAIVNEAIGPGLEKEIQALRNLEPPAGSDQGMQVVITTMQDELRRAKEDPLAFAQSRDPFAGSEKVASKHGFKACGGI